MNYESNIAVFCKESQEKKFKWKGSWWSYTDEADIFEGGIESADIRKLVFNCLKNLEQKMNDLYMLINSNEDMQTTGCKQIIDLTSLVEFLTSKFDQLEKERKEEDELFKSPQIEVFSLKVEVKNLDKKSRRSGAILA